MKLPTPEPGLVIRYSYLWLREHQEGREEGTKDRPCAIILAAHGDTQDQVLVVPVTHSPPDDAAATSLELPQDVKRLLGLDGERSWVVLSESSLFRWPGPDLRPSKGLESSVAFGLLPPKIFSVLQKRFLEIETSRRSTRVLRTE